MLETSGITYAYNSSQSFNFPDFNCQNGEASLILGSSGIGKSTLLHLLGGLIKPKSGTITIDGQDITQIDGSQLDSFRGKNIGIIFQRNHFISSLNVIDNLLLTQKLSGVTQNRSEIMDILDRLEIKNKYDRMTSDLSEGEKQRVSIARAIVNRPKLILADEPTSALDDNNCQRVLDLLNEQAKEVSAALVIVTHDSRLKNSINHQIILS